MANGIDQPYHLIRVIALGHDTNDRLCAGWPDDETANPLKLCLGCGNHGFDGRIFKRLSARKANIFQKLWYGFKQVQNLACRAPLSHQFGQHLKRCDQTVVPYSVRIIWPDCSPPTLKPPARIRSST